MAWEKDINGVVYFWQWLLYTHVIGVVESPTTVYMRDDWEKLSDEKSSLRACRRRIPNRSRVVSCESRIVHMFYYLCLYSLHLLHRTLYRRTHILPFFLRFKCPYHLSCPRLSTSASIIARSWNRQNDVTVTLNIARKKWNFWKERSLRVQTSCKDFDQIGIQQPDACTWAELKFKLWRGLTTNSRVEFHSNLRGRYPPWTSKGSPTFVKNLRNVI